MTFSLKRQIYESMPGWLKAPVGWVPFGWLAGRAYREVYARGPRIDAMTREQIRAYQERELGRMLRYAVEQVPAYAAYRSAVERYAPLEALREFPLLVKDDLQSRFEKFLPRDIDRISHYEISTGGTSGNQLRFFVDDVSQAVETAFVHRLWSRVGYTPSRRKATFRGVSFSGLRPGVFWQGNPVYRELQFSPFHLSEANLPAYIERLRRYRPEYLHGYPSAIDLVAGYILRNNLEGSLSGIRAAFLVSEGFTEQQRERIEAAFRTRVFSFYGHSERLVMGGECEENDSYHHFPDYGVLEIIDAEGRRAEKEGERGEIVGTTLLNRSMPLIRYRTGDLATRLEARCACGRCHDRFGEVEGRWKHDMIVGKSGAHISVAALNMHGPMFDRVVRYQYFQEKPGELLIRILPAPGFSDKNAQAIREAYEEKVKDEVDLVVRVVDDIPLTNRGKLKILDSRLRF